MRLARFVFIMAVCAFVLLALAPAAAETATVKAKIDFVFWVDGQEFQPGEYLFKTTDNNEHFLTIINENDKKKQYALTQDLPQLGYAGRDKLVFKREGNKYVLHQVFLEGNTHGHDVGHAEVAVDIH
jgi:hypothetical protein